VVHGAPGIDEVSPLGITQVVEIRRLARASTVVAEWTIDPGAHGFGPVDAADLAGGSPEENAVLIESILGGGGPAGARAAVLLNAAAALYVAGAAADYASALERARTALDDGAGARVLERLRRVYATA
jgi:anthranilate phosphoribosyltransferase